VIVEYKGEVTHERQKTRSLTRGKAGRHGRYIFDNGNGSFTDAENPLVAGVARFINATGKGEEDDANVEVYYRNGRLFVESIKYIHPRSELLFDYGSKYEWEEGEQKSCYTRLVAKRKPKTKHT
jgi:hypothetical protein